MEICKLETNRTIFNVSLAKNIGQYQIFDPKSMKFKNHSVCNIVNVIFVLYSFFMSMIILVNGVNLWTKYSGHGTDTILNAIYAQTCLFTCYKICIIIYRSHDIQYCFPITQFDFTSVGRQHMYLLELWRNRSFRFTNLYAYMTYISAIIFVTCPLFFGNKLSSLTATDGSTSYYRSNVLNLYTLFSVETYNTYFFSMYFLEMSVTMILIYFMVIFDTLFAELCLSLICHLKIVNTALESLGHEPVIDHQNLNYDNAKTKPKTTDEQCIPYDNLEVIIKDHQSVIQKFEKLLSTFGGIVCSQICVSSSYFILVWFTIIKKFTDEDTHTDTGERTIVTKMLISCPVFIFQLFMDCYLFELINNEKESIIFSLYSCNWTDMDMKCKKLVFMTMMMNNANQKKLKFTPLRVVNLALFLGTMRIVYSVLSVMLKI